mmetsp:Transcript_125475/g.366521  ORF Transcript_125475/g.366521 Transcript_125475/m.366521 type:complete len:85 (-) Transcript_125475:306-560(-)
MIPGRGTLRPHVKRLPWPANTQSQLLSLERQSRFSRWETSTHLFTTYTKAGQMLLLCRRLPNAPPRIRKEVVCLQTSRSIFFML